MHINYSHKAAKQLTSLGTLEQKRISEKMRFFARQPNPVTFAKYISHRESYRFRIGDYRLYFEIKGNIITIRTIERRDKAYD